ncbi:hypothetical protein SAMN05421505_1981, partial [Sinosporangium album]
DLSKWERGLARPGSETMRRLDDLYGAGDRLAELYSVVAEVDQLRTLGRKDSDKENATERRRLLQFAAAGLGSSVIGLTGEPVRQLLDMAVQQEERDLDDWELTCSDHLYAMRTRPSAQVAIDLVADLFLLHRQMDIARADEVPELQRVAAALSSIQANVLTRLGEHGSAIRWWRTARAAADASGEQATRVLVRDMEAGNGLYGQRDLQTVLCLVDSAERIAGGPTVDLLSTRAKALSLLGRHDDAHRIVAAMHSLTDQGVTADRFGFWSANQIHFTESWVYAGAGYEDRAGTARNEVLARTRDHCRSTNVMLHQALCMVARNGIDEGMRYAAQVVDSLGGSYLSHH